MFVELAKMLAEGDKLTIVMMAMKNGIVSLTVVPEGDFTNQPALGAGVSLQGTPEEFDADLASVLTTFTTTRRSLADQIKAQTAILEAAKAAVVATTTKAVGKSQGAAAKAAVTVAVVDSLDDDADADDDAPPRIAGTPKPAATTPTTAAVDLFN